MRIDLDDKVTVYEPFLKWSKPKQMRYLRSLPHVLTDVQAQKLWDKLPKNKRGKKSKDV